MSELNKLIERLRDLYPATQDMRSTKICEDINEAIRALHACAEIQKLVRARMDPSNQEHIIYPSELKELLP